MITFLRKIRKGLLNKNNFSKYFLYAIGEILLVVIGILIAISLNNANQNRMAQIDLDQKLIKVREEVYQDSLRFEFINASNQKVVDRIDQYLELLQGELQEDSYQQLLDYLAEATERFKSFSPNSQSYTGLLNAGDFSRIQNDSLKDKISFLYFYYDHMSTLNYKSIDHMQQYRKELFSKGILSARYINENRQGQLMDTGFQYFQQMLNHPKQKIIFENYLYEMKKLGETIIRRNRQVLGVMNGIPLKP